MIRQHFTFSLKTNIGSVVLITITSSGAILALGIPLIYYPFSLGVWVAARQAWVLVSSSGGVSGTTFILLKALMIKGDEAS